MTIDFPWMHFKPASMTLKFELVDHDRDLGDARLGGHQVEEPGHRLGSVDQVGIHVDVDDVRPTLHLLACDGERLLILVFLDQAGEPL